MTDDSDEGLTFWWVFLGGVLVGIFLAWIVIFVAIALNLSGTNPLR